MRGGYSPLRSVNSFSGFCISEKPFFDSHLVLVIDRQACLQRVRGRGKGGALYSQLDQRHVRVLKVRKSTFALFTWGLLLTSRLFFKRGNRGFISWVNALLELWVSGKGFCVVQLACVVNKQALFQRGFFSARSTPRPGSDSRKNPTLWFCSL